MYMYMYNVQSVQSISTEEKIADTEALKMVRSVFVLHTYMYMYM